MDDTFLLQAVDNGNINKYLSSDELKSPHILTFVADNRLQGVFIMGDTKHTEVRLALASLVQLSLCCASTTPWT